MNSSDGTAEAVGFPIRTSPDQSLLGSSPMLIAAYHVLHRLLVPRHPPYALSSLLIRRDSPLGRTKAMDSPPLQHPTGLSAELESYF